jgi:hypothetical protein
LRLTQHAEPDNSANTIESDNQSSNLEVISKDRTDDHWDDGVKIRRGGEEDRLVARESHPRLKNDWEKV